MSCHMHKIPGMRLDHCGVVRGDGITWDSQVSFTFLYMYNRAWFLFDTDSITFRRVNTDMFS